MANARALETDLQPPLHVGILHAMLAFRGAHAYESDPVIDTGCTESVAHKENGVGLAGFELLFTNVGYESVSTPSTTKLRSRVDFGDPRNLRATPSDRDYGRHCATVHDVDPHETMVNKVLGLLLGLIHAESEWG